MNADYLKALAHQVMIFRTALLANGADEKTADTLSADEMQASRFIAGLFLQRMTACR